MVFGWGGALPHHADRVRLRVQLHRVQSRLRIAVRSSSFGALPRGTLVDLI